MPLHVGADGREVSGRPVHHHQMETIVGRPAAEGEAVPHVEFEIVLHDAAEVRVIASRRLPAERRTPAL